MRTPAPKFIVISVRGIFIFQSCGEACGFWACKGFFRDGLSPAKMEVFGLEDIMPPELILRIYDAETMLDYRRADLFCLGILLQYLFVPTFDYSISLRASISNF